MLLHDIVKQLSLGVFKRLLASDALQLQLENEVYALLQAWLRQSPLAQRKRRGKFFKELAPLLRFHHMIADFVANMVCACSLMEESRLLPSVVRSAIVQRDAFPAVLQRVRAERGPNNRGVSEASWEVKALFKLEAMATLELDQSI